MALVNAAAVMTAKWCDVAAAKVRGGLIVRATANNILSYRKADPGPAYRSHPSDVFGGAATSTVGYVTRSSHDVAYMIGIRAGYYCLLAKSLDCGATWTQQTPPASHLADSVNYSQALAFSDNVCVAVGSPASALYGPYIAYTNDGGATWVSAYIGNKGVKLAAGAFGVNPVTGDLWFVGGAAGYQLILKSTDNGATWAEVYWGTDANTQTPNSINFSPDGSKVVCGCVYTILAGVTYNKSLYSADGGATWSAIAIDPIFYDGGMGGFISSHWIDHTHCFAVGYYWDYGILDTTTMTWTAVADADKPSTFISNAQYLYDLTNVGGPLIGSANSNATCLYTSWDHGRTWDKAWHMAPYECGASYCTNSALSRPAGTPGSPIQRAADGSYDLLQPASARDDSGKTVYLAPMWPRFGDSGVRASVIYDSATGRCILHDGNLHLYAHNAYPITSGPDIIADAYHITGDPLSTANGFGSMSFDIYHDPFTAYSADLYVGGYILLKHDTTVLFEGTVVDIVPTPTGYTVECGGLLNRAKDREDFCYGAVDSDYDRWVAHRRTNSMVSVDTQGQLYLSVPNNSGVISGSGGAVYYWLHNGLSAKVWDTIQSITFDYDVTLSSANWHLALYSAANYVDVLTQGDYAALEWFKEGVTETGTVTLNLTAGTRFLVFRLYCHAVGTTTADQEALISNVRLTLNAITPTVDAVMVDIIEDTGLCTAHVTSTVGDPLETVMVDPFTTRADALAQVAALHGTPVDWGVWEDATFYCKPRLDPTNGTDQATIRALSTAYLIDATDPGITYDVHTAAEGLPEYVRVLYGYLFTNLVDYPSPSGVTWPATWTRSTTTNVTAVASQYKLLANATDTSPDMSGPYMAVSGDTPYRYSWQSHVTCTNGDAFVLRGWINWYDGGHNFISSTTAMLGGVQNADASPVVRVMSPPTAAYAKFFADYVNPTRINTYGTVWNLRFGENYPEGTKRSLWRPYEPANPGLKVAILDLSEHNLYTTRASVAGDAFLAKLAASVATGDIGLDVNAVPIYGGGQQPTPYLRGGHWIEASEVAGHIPLYITDVSLDVDAGTVTAGINPEDVDFDTFFFPSATRRVLPKTRRRTPARKSTRQVKRTVSKRRSGKPIRKTGKH